MDSCNLHHFSITKGLRKLQDDSDDSDDSDDDDDYDDVMHKKASYGCYTDDDGGDDNVDDDDADDDDLSESYKRPQRAA